MGDEYTVADIATLGWVRNLIGFYEARRDRRVRRFQERRRMARARAGAAGGAEGPDDPRAAGMMFALLLAGADPQLINGWAIERGAERCVATRTAGAAHGAIKVEIKSPLSSDFGGTIQLDLPALAVPPPAALPKAPPPEPIRVTIAPTDISAIISYRDGVAMAVMAVTSTQMDQMRGLSSLQVRIGDGPPIAVDLGGTPSPMAALKACGDDVVRSWGADPAAVIGAASPARTASWFLSKDYPKDALRAGIEGRVVFLVSIDRAGKPTTCKVVATTGSASLDSRTCRACLDPGRLCAGVGDGARRPMGCWRGQLASVVRNLFPFRSCLAKTDQWPNRKSAMSARRAARSRSRWQGQCADCGEWNTLVEEAGGNVTPFQAKHNLQSGGRAIQLIGLDAEVDAARADGDGDRRARPRAGRRVRRGVGDADRRRSGDRQVDLAAAGGGEAGAARAARRLCLGRGSGRSGAAARAAAGAGRRAGAARGGDVDARYPDDAWDRGSRPRCW